MPLRLRRLFRHALLFGASGFIGVMLTLVVVFVVYMNSRADLSIWHLA